MSVSAALGPGARQGETTCQVQSLTKRSCQAVPRSFSSHIENTFPQSWAHPAICGQSSSHPNDMKSSNGTSKGVIVLIPYHPVTVTTLYPLKYPESFGLFCNGERCGRQSFLGRTWERRGLRERGKEHGIHLSLQHLSLL